MPVSLEALVRSGSPRSRRICSALLAFQRGDGGFGGFAEASGERPVRDGRGAGRAAVCARARRRASTPAAIARAVAFTDAGAGQSRASTNGARTTRPCKAQLRFEALWALAQQGAAAHGFPLATSLRNRSNFESATQIRLARYLLRAPGWQRQRRGDGDALAADASTYRALRDRERLDAMELARIAGPGAVADAATVARAARSGRTARRRGSRARCAAMPLRLADDRRHRGGADALSAYAATERLAPGSATATVGGKTIGTAHVRCDGIVADVYGAGLLAAAASSLVIASTAGTSALYRCSTPIRCPANAPGELAAFRVMRILSDPSVAASASTTRRWRRWISRPLPPVRVAAGTRLRRRRARDRRSSRGPAGHRRSVAGGVRGGGYELPHHAAGDRAAKQQLADRHEPDLSRSRRRVRGALGPGVYDLHYLVRSVTPGTFAWPGARAYLQDAPEQFGRSAGTTLKITE